MADADLTEFERLSAPKKKPCPVPDAIAGLKRKDATDVKGALERPAVAITNTAISKWFEIRGVAIGHATIRSHRCGSCTCADG